MTFDPSDIHLSWLKEQLLSCQRELYDAERDLVEAQAKVESLRGSADYFYGILKLARNKEQVISVGHKVRELESDSAKSGIQAKDLVRLEFANLTVKEAAQIVIDRHAQPLFVEDLIKELYDVRTEEEELMVKRTLASELRRGASEGLWQKLGKTQYASNLYVSESLSALSKSQIHMSENNEGVSYVPLSAFKSKEFINETDY